MVLIVVGFILVMQAAASVYDLRGPVLLIGDDLVGVAGGTEVKIAGMALALMCMPARLRLPFIGVVVAVESVFNAQRLIVGNTLHLGNGVMWGLIALAVYALAVSTGAEREKALKAVGIAAILIVTSRVAGVWLGLTEETLPEVADHFVEVADRALGSPSWVMGRFVEDTPWFRSLISQVYNYLSVGAAIVAFFQLRRSSVDGFPRHHIVRSFIVIGALGPLVYFLFPVVGPVFAFGDELPGAGWLDVWPHTVPTSLEPVSAFFSQDAPRNCMPSLHTAWATAILVHALRGPRLLKVYGVFWFVCTLSATLGLGYHYGVDLIAGLVFALTVECALARPQDGWHRLRVAAVAGGAAAFAVLLAAFRYLSVPMAQNAVVSTILMLGSVAAMTYCYVRISRTPVDVPATPVEEGASTP